MKKLRTFLFSSVPLLLAIALQFLAMYYILIIAAIFMMGIAPATSGKHYDYNDFMELLYDYDFNGMIYIVFSMCCIVLFGIWYYKRGGQLRINPKTTFHPLELLGIAFLVPGAQYLSSLILGIVSIIFPSWLEAYNELLETAGLSEDIGAMMMIYSVLMAPIGEELIFRGVTLRILQSSFPFWLANIIQAFFFGCFHMNMLQGVYTFVVGLILGYIYKKGGSIYHCIIFHLLFNLWGTTASQWLIVDNEILQVLIVYGSLILGLVFGFMFLNKGSKAK